MASTSTITLTQADAARAFAEWERRVRADPSAWAAEAEIRQMDPEEHGEGCAAVFFDILKDLG